MSKDEHNGYIIVNKEQAEILRGGSVSPLPAYRRAHAQAAAEALDERFRAEFKKVIDAVNGTESI